MWAASSATPSNADLMPVRRISVKCSADHEVVEVIEAIEAIEAFEVDRQAHPQRTHR
jgi:hypothetical protein